MSGAAVASRLLWAWSGWRDLPRSGAQEQQPSSWAGPGVHISYTHIEMHWPLDR
ncbi:hypothetical protein [Pseudonocardia acidicola]|uniref:Uncharacterized protein n=1 Tax=Pseudonocardia acidicola TaxID=2724939 RepID=A0ABX1S9P4_9PSEU|nr:hypothetical protein [Pseudonocardia acidicola]NMH98286.1 hypothetical protein [Pseudonocardia acidicola]